MRRRVQLLSLLFLFATAAMAQTEEPAVLPQEQAATPAAPPEGDKRIFGVLPNYRTTEAGFPYQPITAKQKLTIAAKDSFTWPAYPTSAAFAALHQIDNDNPSFGQGMAGYAKRWAAAYGDQMIGNMFQEGIIPALGHQDPRYFRLGEGSKKHRIWYALTQIMVARLDSGRKTFNFSEWGGAATAVAISNAYYPDQRTVGDNVEKLFVATATDAFSNVAKEFWPDIKRYFQRSRERKLNSSLP